MTGAGVPADPLSQAVLAARLLAVAPGALGGLSLRGAGPVRDTVVEQLGLHFPDAACRRIPTHVDDGQLMGGIDIAASLAARRPVIRPGLLDQIGSGALIVPMGERLGEAAAGRLAQALDARRGGSNAFALVLLDDGREPDEAPPIALTERIAFHCDLSSVNSLHLPAFDTLGAIAFDAVETPGDAVLGTLAHVAEAFGVDSVRSLLFALATARAHAALCGRKELEQVDLDVAALLVLVPRATRFPADPPPQDQHEPAPPLDDRGDTAADPRSADEQTDMAERVIDAVAAVIPEGLFDQLARGRQRRGKSQGRSGKRTRSTRRGKPLGARPGQPRGGARLALIDTLRAAVPWQPLRRREAAAEAGHRLLIRKDDLRVRRFEEQVGIVTIFCVDASGSAALARLSEAKGAVELILAQAYVTRCEVALIAFRGTAAELLLPPTRSLTRARRALAALPGGGGTPLAAGLALAGRTAEAISARGSSPFLVVLTDGSANITAAGLPGRGQARDDALAAARAIAARRTDALVIDISPRPRADAERLAAAMAARYLPLPLADAKAIERAVRAAQPGAVAA